MARRGSTQIQIGQQFDRLTVLEILPAIYLPGRVCIRRTSAVCQCVCGNVVTVRTDSLGRVKSCKCLQAVANITHGIWDTPEYRAYWSMRTRCYCKTSRNYHRYGGRGILVCQEWLDDPQAFFNYIGLRPSSCHSLDRYPDKDGNYEPGNVRWATREEQGRNRCDTIYLTLNTETLPLMDWADRLNVSRDPLYRRYRKGWTDERILTTPVRTWGRA